MEYGSFVHCTSGEPNNRNYHYKTGLMIKNRHEVSLAPFLLTAQCPITGRELRHR